MTTYTRYVERKSATSKRFLPIVDDERFVETERTRWYYDTERPLDGVQPWVAVECYKDRDPNDYVRHEELQLLFTDQAEYYAVCPGCHGAYSHMQWSGHTRIDGWEELSQRYLEKHTAEKGWCEFCDPVFGTGGWV